MKTSIDFVADMFELINFEGVEVSVFKDEYKTQIFKECEKLISQIVSLELVVLNDSVSNYAENAIDKDDLLEFLKAKYKIANTSLQSVSGIIPTIFYTDFKENKDTETFIDFVICELKNQIISTQKIPDIEESVVLLNWEELERNYLTRKFLKNRINYYLQKPIESNLFPSKYPRVFKDNLGMNFFKEILGYLNAFDENGKQKQGDLAKVSAIYSYERKQYIHPSKKVMKEEVSLKDLVDFLINEFGFNIKYHNKYKLSNGDRYIEKVKQFYKANLVL